VVGGGIKNNAAGNLAVVGGGRENAASGIAATVPGGYLNAAEARFSFAAGQRAKARHEGAFVWADSTGADVASTARDQFVVRASGGTTFYSDPGFTAGVTLPPGGGSWSSVSDAAVKQNVTPVHPEHILEQVTSLPLSTWNYESQDASIRHIGPMAQDFRAVFGVGENERYITTVDADGVALAAIQGLNQKIERLEERLAKTDGTTSRSWNNAASYISGLLGFAFGIALAGRRRQRDGFMV
jgi:hypothetical protein